MIPILLFNYNFPCQRFGPCIFKTTNLLSHNTDLINQALRLIHRPVGNGLFRFYSHCEGFEMVKNVEKKRQKQQ